MMFYKLSKLFFILYLFYTGWYSQLFFNNTAIPLLLSLAMLTFYTLHKLSTKNITITIPYALLVLFIFFFYALTIGMFIAGDTSHLLNSLFTYIIRLVFMLYIINVSVTEKDNKFFIYVWLVYSIVYMISMLLWGYDYGRLVLSEETNPNGDALTLLVGIFCALIVLKPNRINQLLLTLIIVGTSLYTIMLTGSRKSFLAAILMVFLWSVFVFKDYWKSFNIQKKIASFVLLIFSFIFIRIKFLPIFLESPMYLRFIEKGIDITEDTVRSGMYSEALNFFYNNPIFGVGYNHYRIHSVYETYSHSTYAELISTTGIIGTIIYFAAYAIIIYNLIKLLFRAKDNVNTIRVTQYLILMGIMLILGTGVIHFYSFRDNVVLAIIISFYYLEKSNLNNKEVIPNHS